MAEPDTLSAAPAPAAQPRTTRRGLGWSLGWRLGLALAIVALLVGLPLGGLLALRDSQAALSWSLQRVPGLQVQDLQGTLGAGRLRARSLHWQLPAGAGELRIGGLDLQGHRRRHLAAIEARRAGLWARGGDRGLPVARLRV